MTTSAHHPDEILVLLGTGTTGRRILTRLRDMGVPARAGSRTGAPPFDWHDPGTWPAALRGARAVYVAYHPDLAVPGASEAVGRLAAMAHAAGVRRIVLLSGRGEPAAQRAEQVVRDAGPGWTVLRSAWFAQNFSEGHLAGDVMAGELALPVPDVPEPFVDVDDVADAAAAALTAPDHEGRVYELTGPAALTFAEAAAAISRAAGRPLAVRSLPAGAFAARLEGQGLPPGEAAFLTGLFAEVLDGRNSAPAEGVPHALGRPARPFDAFARDAARDGAWGAP